MSGSKKPAYAGMVVAGFGVIFFVENAYLRKKQLKFSADKFLV
jgi:hypothetical protein